MKKQLLALALSCAFVGAAHADNNQPNPVHFMAGIGLSVGGQTINTVQYTDGSSSNISSGTGGIIHAGLDWRISESFSSQLTVGYQFRETPAASNGDARFTRIPVDLLFYYHPDQKWRLGLGAEYVVSPKVSGSGEASYVSEDFKNALGAIVEVEYFFSPQISMKVRGVKENYKPQDGGPSIDGSHAAIIGDYYF
ncbi:MAG: outer membrane beta-barrel protein [Burkholderiaceae bacterium]|nr:outer membrane beta-barrel protein [Burkholderiaceae bacterium]